MPAQYPYTIVGICARCTHPVGYVADGRLTDTAWDEERCYPHDDPEKTHIVRTDIINIAMMRGSERPTAVWNALAALVRAERVPPGMRGSHVKSAARALAGGRVNA